jgi:hypothetical protein
MNNKNYLDLIHREIDGELEPGEREVLQEILVKDEELRRMHANLAKAAATVAKVPEKDPPRDLVKNVMARIDPSRYTVKKPGLLESLITFFEPRRGLAAAFAAIILIAVVFISVSDFPEQDRLTELTGTIGSPRQQVDEFTLNGQNFRSMFRINSLEDRYLVEGKVNFDGDYRIRIYFHPEGRVLTDDKNSRAGAGQLAFHDNSYVLVRNGDHEFSFVFKITRDIPDYVAITVEPVGDAVISKKIILQ